MEQVAKYYDDIYKNSVKYSLPYQQSIYYDMWVRLSRWIRRKDNVVDIGCGPGQFADLLYQKFGEKIKYSGVDFSGVAIKKARELVPGYQFYWQDAFEFIQGKEFDKYIMTEFLEHIDNDTEIIEMIPQGKEVIFSVPNYVSKSHVRTFKYQEEIIQRYDELISIKEMYKFNFTETRFITLVRSKRI